jgi:hypothetical protein
MPITTLDGLLAAPSQNIYMIKTAGMSAIAATPFSPFAQAGSPGAGVLAGTSTTTGVVPVAGDVGYPTLASFGGLKGYLSRVAFGSSLACRIHLFDILWKGGAYAFNAAVTGQTPTSYASRVLGGTDFTGLELWYEQVTSGTGVQSFSVTYTNEAGVTGRSTGGVSLGTAGTVGRMMQVPLASGDRGLRGVTGVAGSVATAGTFNILVMRRLWSGRVRINNDGDTHDFLKTELPEIFQNSALRIVVAPDSTNTGIPELDLTIVAG